MRFDEARNVLPGQPSVPASALERQTFPDASGSFLQPPPGPAQRFDFPVGAIPLDVVDMPAAAADLLRLKVPETHAGLPAGLNLDVPQSMVQLADLRVLGQVYDSFILAAGSDGLWIIDQHVAHERILFERTIAVKAVPADLEPGGVESAIYEILEIAESELRRVSVDDLRRGIAASLACRAAIKINTPLDRTRMEYLLQELARTACPMSCPHGRPVALRYSTRDILRSFHRI